VDSIRDYRLSANDVRVELLAKSLSALQSGASPEKVLVELSNKLTNRLIHEPTKALQTAAQSQQFDKLGVIRQTLGLDDN
jgi:glutamyl-tRNA reductase